MEKIKDFYKNKKILVTGATGFKGAWMCSWLNKLGAKVYGIGHSPNKNKNLFYKLNLDKKIKLKLFDIRNYDRLPDLHLLLEQLKSIDIKTNQITKTLNNI